MSNAIENLDSTEDDLSEKDLIIINNSPLPELMNNRGLSPAGQRYAQAMRQYTEALLRRESGAAISIGEFDNARRTFARQSGDMPETLAQKRNSRYLTAEGVAAAAGRALGDKPGDKPQGEKPPAKPKVKISAADYLKGGK